MSAIYSVNITHPQAPTFTRITKNYTPRSTGLVQFCVGSSNETLNDIWLATLDHQTTFLDNFNMTQITQIILPSTNTTNSTSGWNGTSNSNNGSINSNTINGTTNSRSTIGTINSSSTNDTTNQKNGMINSNSTNGTFKSSSLTNGTINSSSTNGTTGSNQTNGTNTSSTSKGQLVTIKHQLIQQFPRISPIILPYKSHKYLSIAPF